jgi:hypothetical protein
MKVTLDIKLTAKDVVETAGSKYWATCYNSYDDIYNIVENDTEKIYIFDDVMLQAGLQNLMNHKHLQHNVDVVGRILSGVPDSLDADVILQLSTLGEVKYG